MTHQVHGTGRLALIDRLCDAALAERGDVRNIVTIEAARIAPLATDIERDQLIESALSRIDGLGVLDELLSDPAVDEVMINGGSDIWVERAGRLIFHSTIESNLVDTLLERALAPLGRRVDRTSPVVDARLPNGARLCAVVAPVALGGTCVNVRRHRRNRFRLESFAPPDVVEIITQLVIERANVLIAGATSSGKTSLLAAMLGLVDDGDRTIVLEDTAELPIELSNGVRLEARPATADADVEVALEQLVVAAMRLRPDRLVLGEFRGPEVKAVIEALNTGHDGSMSTCHANSAHDALRRVETLLMQAAPSWPLAAIRRQIYRSLDAVVFVGRDRNGARRIRSIGEVVADADEPTLRVLASDELVLDHFTRGRRRS